jgi:hypothetical protein
MDYLIGLGVLGLGYQLQTNKDNKVKKNFIGTVPKSQQPSQENTYTSKLAYNIFQDEQKKADILLEKSKYPQDTNVVTPGPPFPIMYNKVDFSDKNLPIEFNSESSDVFVFFFLLLFFLLIFFFPNLSI